MPITSTRVPNPISIHSFHHRGFDNLDRSDAESAEAAYDIAWGAMPKYDSDTASCWHRTKRMMQASRVFTHMAVHLHLGNVDHYSACIVEPTRIVEVNTTLKKRDYPCAEYEVIGNRTIQPESGSTLVFKSDRRNTSMFTQRPSGLMINDGVLFIPRK
jgi:hypothetical protein